jgi:diguanylate cyclase (GGDEF)-like protein
MNLLLIDDNDVDASRIQQLIATGSGDGVRVRHVHTCEQGLDALGEQAFDVILVDLSPPDTGCGEPVASLIRKYSATPVVVLSGNDNTDVAVHAVRLGVQDYLVKGRLAVDQLQRAIRFAIERKHNERHLEFLAGYDPLTTLLNRHQFNSMAEHALANAERQGIGAAMLFIDLDRFKAINDQWGHAAGDELLAAVGRRIRGSIRRGDTAARLGGDEFAVFLEAAGQRAAETVAEKIRTNLAKPVHIAGRPQPIMASIGLALFPRDGTDLATLLYKADQAMYRAKGHGATLSKRRQGRGDPGRAPVPGSFRQPAPAGSGSLKQAEHG